MPDSVLQENQEDAVASPELSRASYRDKFYTLYTRYASIIVGIVVFVLAIVFNFHKLGLPSIWYDEAFSVELARQPLPRLLDIIFVREPNMELYYLLLHFWLQLTNIVGLLPTESLVRFPSAVFATASIVLVFWLGKRYVGLWGAGLAAVLCTLEVVQLTYAQQTRAYSLEVLLTCIAWFALLNALVGDPNVPTSSSRRSWWITYGVATVLGAYTHLFTFILIFAQLVAVVGILLIPNAWQARARQRLRALLICLLITAALCIPMVVVSLLGSKTGWLTKPGLKDIAHLFLTITNSDKSYLLLLFGCIGAGVLIIGASYILQRASRIKKTFERELPFSAGVIAQQEYLPLLWTLLCWLVLPVALSFIISQTETRLFSSRYLVVVVPPLFLLVSLGLLSLRNRGLQLLLALQLLFLAVNTVPLYYRSAQVEDWNSVSHWLIDRYQTDDRLVCYDNFQGSCQISIEYYLHAYPTSGAAFPADAPNAFSWEKFNYGDPPKAVTIADLEAYGKAHKRLFFITGRISSDVMAAGATDATTWLDTNYRFIGEIKTRTVTIRLYATNP